MDANVTTNEIWVYHVSFENPALKLHLILKLPK